MRNQKPETRNQNVQELKEAIRSIGDFPKKGILFRDITTLLKDGQKFRHAVEIIAARYAQGKIDKVVAVEARGFILGGAVAYKLNAGFVPVRKQGKLPAQTYAVTYQLEYGTDTLQIHCDALEAEDRVVIVDDLLATGGTAKAVCQLVEKSGAQIVGIEFLIELTDLQGKDKLKGYPLHSIIRF